jgi:hypothetical protein
MPFKGVLIKNLSHSQPSNAAKPASSEDYGAVPCTGAMIEDIDIWRSHGGRRESA